MPGRYQVKAEAPGHNPSQAEVEVQGGFVHVVLNLEAACTTRLVVRAEGDDPVVVAVKSAHRFMEATGRTGEVLQVVGGTGAATMTARTVGSQVQTASVTATLCGPDPVEIVLAKSDGTTGEILAQVENQDGDPVAGKEVWVEGGKRGVTNAQGKVRFLGLTPQKYLVGTVDSSPVQVEVTAGVSVDAVLVLGRSTGVIQGTVVRAQTPVEGARLLAACADSGRDPGLLNAAVVARSDADGHFSFRPRDGGICTVRAEHDAHGRSRLVTLRSDQPPAEIELLASGSISGTISLKFWAEGQAPF